MLFPLLVSLILAVQITTALPLTSLPKPTFDLNQTQARSTIQFTSISSIGSTSSSIFSTTKINYLIQNSCWVQSKWRGFSSNAISLNYQCLGAAASQCYSSCPSGYTGAGPVCWGSCPQNMFTCAVALCTPDALECTKDVIDIITNTLETGMALAEIGENPVQFVVHALNLALKFVHPICSSASPMKSNSFSFLMICIAIGALTFVQRQTYG